MTEQHDHDNTWMVARFDRIDEDNDAIKTDLKIVSDKVIRHGVYWDIVKYSAAAGGGVSGVIAAIFGWNHKS